MPYQLTSPLAEGVMDDPEETGTTFKENALLKARHFAQPLRMLTIADDSGLEVDALDGNPGVWSARFAGTDASDAQRVQLILDKLRGLPWEKRRATFRCMVAIVTPEGQEWIVEGSCVGGIANEPKGDNGFGYDPIFFVSELGKNMAEMTSVEKNEISHRGRAARKAVEILKEIALDKNKS